MTSDKPLVAFLYTLLRDELPAGTVEQLVRDAEQISILNVVMFSNDHLARYALELAKRLT